MATVSQKQSGPMSMIRCIVCGGNALPRFRKAVNGLVVEYCECSVCGHLTSTQFTLRTDYSGMRYFVDIDHGWESRNAKILQICKLLTRLPGLGLSRSSTVLDFGCGKGRLVRTLAASGFNVYGFEPFVGVFETDRVYTDLEKAREALHRVDLILLIEVIEHTRLPSELLSETTSILRTGGYLLVSTGIFESRRHDEEWYYLKPEAGHVSIFSKESLIKMLGRFSFLPVIRINETMWLFGRTSGLVSRLKGLTYYILSSLRVVLKPSRLMGVTR
jgi:2-polyprenyl-3-methyl-5-hydroxy-6-metoxy-1,4-benzoquinol methylase